jgi:hypothetical protein
MRALLLTLATIAMADPAAAQTRDMCALLAANPGWTQVLDDVEQRWGVTPGVVLAIIDQESRFVPAARGPGADGADPERNFGYAQANRRTWHWFLRDSGWAGSRSRTDFEASAHFIGWHFASHTDDIDAPASDTYRHYLVYKQGLGGYRRGPSQGARQIARTVVARAQRAQSQLTGC